MDITLLRDTISGLKLAADISKSFLELKSLSEVQARAIELQSAILAAQSSALEANANQAMMAEEIRSLKEQIERLKAWENEKKRYKLTSAWSNSGVVYALKQSMKKSEPPHMICTKCYEDGRKSILNPVTLGGFISYTCPVCKLQISTGLRGTKIEYAPD